MSLCPVKSVGGEKFGRWGHRLLCLFGFALGDDSNHKSDGTSNIKKLRVWRHLPDPHLKSWQWLFIILGIPAIRTTMPLITREIMVLNLIGRVIPIDPATCCSNCKDTTESPEKREGWQKLWGAQKKNHLKWLFQMIRNPRMANVTGNRRPGLRLVCRSFQSILLSPSRSDTYGRGSSDATNNGVFIEMMIDFARDYQMRGLGSKALRDYVVNRDWSERAVSSRGVLSTSDRGSQKSWLPRCFSTRVDSLKKP